MTINIEKAFEVTDGVLVNEDSNGNYIEGPFYTGGPSSPIGLNLPEKTIYVQNRADGIKVWRKFGNGVNDWAIHDNNIRKSVDHQLTIPAGTTQILNSNEFLDCLIINGEGYVI